MKNLDEAIIEVGKLKSSSYATPSYRKGFLDCQTAVLELLKLLVNKEEEQANG